MTRRARIPALVAVAALLARDKAQKPEGLLPFTPRPPLYPTELSVLASLPVDESQPPVGGMFEELGAAPPVLRPEAPVPARAKVVIIGGGINGTGIARDAAGRGLSVLLAERGDQLVAVAPRQVDLLVAVRVAEERADGLARGGDQPPVGGALGGLVDPHQ